MNSQPIVLVVANGMTDEVLIYDAGGRLITTVPVLSGRFQWNGCDRPGRLVPGGIYFLKIKETKTPIKVVKAE